MRMSLLFSVALLTACLPSPARPADNSQSEPLIDAVELKIERGRHERLLAVQTAPGAALSPFSSDGCSGGLSSVWKLASASVPALARRHGEHPPWESCCVAHDQSYHAGAPSGADPRASFDARRRADEELRQCVRKIGADRTDALAAEYGIGREEVELIYSGIADVMYRAVRLGGAPCTGLAWRWGYGWPDCR